MDVLKCWAHENNIPGTLTVLCNNTKVKDLIMNDMLTWGKQVGLKSFEQVSFPFHQNGFLAEERNFLSKKMARDCSNMFKHSLYSRVLHPYENACIMNACLFVCNTPECYKVQRRIKFLLADEKLLSTRFNLIKM